MFVDGLQTDTEYKNYGVLDWARTLEASHYLGMYRYIPYQLSYPDHYRVYVSDDKYIC